MWSFVTRRPRRSTGYNPVGVENLESRQLLSAVSTLPETAEVGHAEPSMAKEKTHIFWLESGDVQVTEGNEGTKTLTLTIASSPQAKKNIKIQGQFKIAGEGAGFADGDDFTIAPFSAVIKKGEASTTVEVTISGDTVIEPDETFEAVIEKASGGAVIDNGVLTATILNDDVGSDLPVVTFQGNIGSPGTEGQTQHFTLALDKPSLTDVLVTVHLSGSGGPITTFPSATVPDDVQFAGGESDLVITIPAGSTTKTFDVLLVDDSLPEATEAYSVTITSATGAAAGSPGILNATIQDNDGPPLVSIAAHTSIVEGNSGTATSPVVVTLSHVTDHDVIVHYTIAVDQEADHGHRAKKKKDFVATSGTVTIAAGQTTANIPVQIVGDTIVESDEDFLVLLTSAEAASISASGSAGFVTILNDDGLSE